MQKEFEGTNALPDLSDWFSNIGSCAAAEVDDVQEVSSENRDMGKLVWTSQPTWLQLPVHSHYVVSGQYGLMQSSFTATRSPNNQHFVCLGGHA